MVSLPTVNARCTVRTPTVTSWLTSSIMQIWGAHFLGRRSGQYLRESYPLRAPIWRPNVAGASTWKGWLA